MFPSCRVCPNCFTSFKTTREFSIHKRECKSTNAQIEEIETDNCPHCGRKFSNRGIKSHITSCMQTRIWDPSEANTSTTDGRHSYFIRTSPRDELSNSIIEEFKEWILLSKNTNTPVLKHITKVKYCSQFSKILDYFEVCYNFINSFYLLIIKNMKVYNVVEIT
jgi:Zn-finger nucleic acid-binding protein